jgi:hypothetical protein
MDDARYVLIARRDPSRTEVLTLRYETRELALAAATTLREFGSIVFVIKGGDLPSDSH